MLTDIAIRSTKPADKSYKLADAQGLYLRINPNGSRWWRFDYRFDGKRKTLSVGTYPDVGLKEARIRRDEMRSQLLQGIDPGLQRKAQKSAHGDSYEAIAREWHAKFSPTWAPDHSKRILRRMEADIFPWIGSCSMKNLRAIDVLACLRRIEQRGAIDTAHRTLQNCGQIFRYAVATGRADRDITSDLKGSLPPARGKHFAAIIDGTSDPSERERKIADLLKKLDSYKGSFVIRMALKMAPLVFVRPGELRKMLWADIDLERCEWRYKVTKTQTDHIVPLSHQSMAILQEIMPLTGSGAYVFPGARDPKTPMSSEALRQAMRRMGISKDEMTGHGFRAVARTMLDEVMGFRIEHIEQQLAHAVRDANGRAYNRTAHLEARKEMMQAWADYLDRLITPDSATSTKAPSKNISTRTTPDKTAQENDLLKEFFGDVRVKSRFHG